MGTVDVLISGLRATCAGLPDKRHGKNSHYVMTDIGMAAFSPFFMQSPSFLAHQRQLEDGRGSDIRTAYHHPDVNWTSTTVSEAWGSMN